MQAKITIEIVVDDYEPCGDQDDQKLEAMRINATLYAQPIPGLPIAKYVAVKAEKIGLAYG